MNVDARSALIHVVCPHCHSTNRVVETRSVQARCGDCSGALFEGRPAAVDAAAFGRHLARSDLPVVVDFWAPWCAPCRTMTTVFETVAQELEPHYRFVKVNTDEEGGLATRHRIRAIPTFAIFRNGNEVVRTAGAMDAARLIAWVRANA